jgi:hypothetical protein
MTSQVAMLGREEVLNIKTADVIICCLLKAIASYVR